MAVRVSVTGNGSFLGAGRTVSSVDSYSISEEATPIDISDSSGAVGQITLGVQESNSYLDGPLLINNEISMVDDYRGVTMGKVIGLNSTDGKLSITADSRLAAFVAVRKAAPYNGTLGGALTYYMSLGGITSGFVIDSTLASIPVTFQGWDADIWTMLKSICAVYNFEISLVSNNIVVRPIRTREVINYKNISVGWAVQNSELARAVEVNYYQNTFNGSGLVYPKGGWNEDVQVLQVNTSETIEYELPVDVSLLTLEQPTCVLFVSRDSIGPTSVYAVAGNDGLPIPVAQWEATGGSLKVKIGPEGKSIVVTLTGSSISEYAPYRIAVTAGPSDTYSSLRLVGSGVFYDKKTVTIRTGVEDSRTATLIGTTVDSIFVNSYQDALTVGGPVAARYGSPNQTISVSASAVNKRGETGDATYPTVAFVNNLYVGLTVAQVNALWLGQTIQDMQNYFYSLVQNNFENQAFGNVAGARVLGLGAYYRIKSAQLSDSNISYTAERDTTVQDVQNRFNGMTVSQVNGVLAGRTLEQFSVTPLG